nr:helix-turn-helix domain-containing protein [Streptomyces sp. ERV7]
MLSIPEAAELLGTSTRMPRRLVVERRVPVVKVGRHVRFWESDLLAYLAAQTIPARTAGHLSAPGTARDTKGIARAVRAR